MEAGGGGAATRLSSYPGGYVRPPVLLTGASPGTAEKQQKVKNTEFHSSAEEQHDK